MNCTVKRCAEGLQNVKETERMQGVYISDEYEAILPAPKTGVGKKIQEQIQTLKDFGLFCEHICVRNKPITLWDKIRMRTFLLGDGLSWNVNNVIREADFLYIRKPTVVSRNFICFLKEIRNVAPCCKILLELPTYPYDNEYSSIYGKITLFIDKCFRKTLAKYLYRIITFSDYKSIFGTPTIQISNGIDFDKIKLKQNINDTSHELHLIGVAEIHYWHGFDRLVQGLVNYYKGNPDYKVFFHIVGDFFGERERNDILPLISTHHLESYIILHGAKHGEELDLLFEQSDMAIGSLARHRSGITNIKTLKNREYAARGLSFIYSEQDSDFENKPYILKVPADESPIDINLIIDFYKKLNTNPLDIRSSIQCLSWEKQMKKVIAIIQTAH